MKTFTNPILSGFYPDPSICRTGKEYYLVTSSFTYFPGIPIFHSRDLVHWQQIGHVLTRSSQLPLDETQHSHGIFAPTIRYHQGVFYVVATNITNGGNFLVTAKDPKGPWSEPVWLDSQGIDPSLYFEGDRCFYCGTQDRREGSLFWGDNEIYIQELDTKSLSLVGPSHVAWHGALRECKWVESPHIYHRDGWYYLMISEGGTGYEHAISIARSQKIEGPYEGYEGNPILTHRHLGRQYPISNVGHGDLVETQTGEWWMVCLASRPYGGYYRNLGRETFLAPLIWEEGWPVICPGKGHLSFEEKCPDLMEEKPLVKEEVEGFGSTGLAMDWVHLKNPLPNHYRYASDTGILSLKVSTNQLNGFESPTMLLRRQKSQSMVVETRLDFDLDLTDRGGLCLYQSNRYYYTLELYCHKEGTSVRVVRCLDGYEEVVYSMPCKQVTRGWDLRIEVNEQSLTFLIKEANEGTYTVVVEDLDGRLLSTDVAGGFVGTMIGLFALTQDERHHHFAHFQHFSIKPLQTVFNMTVNRPLLRYNEMG